MARLVVKARGLHAGNLGSISTIFWCTQRLFGNKFHVSQQRILKFFDELCQIGRSNNLLLKKSLPPGSPQ